MGTGFRHANIGTSLTKTEWEAETTHIADGQTANDLTYFDGTNWVRAPAATVWAILDGVALESSPTDGVSTKAPDSNWAFDHNATNTGVHGAGASTLATAATLATHTAIASAHHEKTGLDDTPVDGQTAEGITSNWAYDHAANPTAHQAGYTAPTRSFWVLPMPAVGSAGTEIMKGDYYSWFLDAASTEAVGFSFGVPADFSSLTTVKIVFIGKGTGTPTCDWTVTTDFGADGEAYNANSDTATADGLALVADEIDTIDISAAFTGLAAGDFVGVKFILDAFSGTTPGLYVIGLEFKYAE
uniref:Uncharacterized protein n=1 Tax=viral metagenome TaxID=1070528 RepID=A0A6M3IFU0_9ZZZZ